MTHGAQEGGDMISVRHRTSIRGSPPLATGGWRRKIAVQGTFSTLTGLSPCPMPPGDTTKKKWRWNGQRAIGDNTMGFRSQEPSRKTTGVVLEMRIIGELGLVLRSLHRQGRVVTNGSLVAEHNAPNSRRIRRKRGQHSNPDIRSDGDVM